MRAIEIVLSTSERNNVGQIVIRQDDKDSQQLIADIIENGKPKNLAGYTVFFNARVKGGVIARDLVTVTDSSQVSYVIKDAFYQKLGKVEGFFSFEKNNQSESTANFDYHVISGCKRDIKQGSYIFEFEQLKEVVGDIFDNQSLLPLLEKITEVESKTDSYEKDNNNPHKVTASQTGAYTKEESDKKIKDHTRTEINKKIVKAKVLYSGGDDDGRFFDDTNEFKYNLASNQRMLSVETLWSRFNENNDNQVNNFGYQSFETRRENLRNGSYYLPLHFTKGTDVAVKQVYVKADSISGHERNYTDPICKLWKLRKATVYYYEV